MTPLLLALALLLALLPWLVARLLLEAPDLSAWDHPEEQRFAGAPHSPAAQAVLARIQQLRQSTAQAPLHKRLQATRQAWDQLFADQTPDADFIPIRQDGIQGEWVLAPGVDPARRTLYVHGGSYVLGSPRTHRPLTTAFSRVSGGAVLALDYRLMPEHRRMAGIMDTRQAYQWMLAHAPAGESPAGTAFVAGDSAGGNLVLALLLWLRDRGLREPDAAVVLSPQTDSTMSSPSMVANMASDPMLGPNFGLLVRLPRWLLLWAVCLQCRMSPRRPVVSPVLGELSRLPPTLIQLSSTEMLCDDGRRYAARARAAGSPVLLQSWTDMVHVWQLFNPELPEAQQALEEIARFLANPKNGSRQAPCT